MTARTRHAPSVNVDYVAVDDEPDHVEQFRSQSMRVYLAAILPGGATMYHRHERDTFYVILAGGRFRSDEPGRQRSRTRVGRSVPRPRQLLWLICRILSGGWLRIPTGTLLVQPHTAHPLIHRVHADRRNDSPVLMLGIEPRKEGDRRAAALETGRALRLEHEHPGLNVYRLRLHPGERFIVPALRSGGVLVATAGEGSLNGRRVRAHPLHPAAIPLDPGSTAIRATGQSLSALLFAL